MYGYLEFKIDSEQGLTATVPAWLTMTDVVSAEEFSVRKKKCLPLVQELCKGVPDFLTRVEKDLTSILALGEKLPVEFAVHMCVAHHRLPPTQRAQRIDTITRMVEAYFSDGDLKYLPQTMGPALTELKQMALLVPDAMLEDEIRSECFEFANRLSLFKTPPKAYDMNAFPGQMLAQLKGVAIPKQTEVLNELVKFVLSRQPVHRTDWQKKILTLLEQKKGGSLSATYIQLSMWPKAIPLLAIHRYDFYEGAIDHLLTVGTADWTLIVGDFAQAMQANIKAQADVVVWASVTAVLEDVSMGPYTASSMEAVQKRIQASLGIRNGFTLERIHKARALVAVDEHKLSEQDALELRTVQAMSVDQLVRWIEGPIAEARSTRKPIDRQAIARSEQERQKKNLKSKPVTTQTPLLETPVTEESVGDTTYHTLSANAGIWQHEIDRMIGLSKSIKEAQEVAGESITKCSSMREDLIRLTHKPEAFDVEDARDLLLNAEQAVLALRKDLGKAKAVTRVHDRFAGKLSEAIDKEPKVLGKPHGGRIECPLSFDDWNYVADNFHGRWLPNIKTYVVDSKHMPLDNDQAAALYVTASSLSGYAFDVSVHLWRRRGGCTGLAGIRHALYAPMNAKEWFDTYETFCVLHIPLKS
jgi:fructose-specific phosphotransferase system component IIB